MSDIEPGPIYRPGRPSRKDYADAAADIAAAMLQLEPDGHGCTVCHDSGHQAWECHHNPLVMARRAVAAARVWRCYHCGEVFTDHLTAEMHFGRTEYEVAACQRGQGSDDAATIPETPLATARASVYLDVIGMLRGDAHALARRDADEDARLFEVLQDIEQLGDPEKFQGRASRLLVSLVGEAWTAEHDRAVALFTRTELAELVLRDITLYLAEGERRYLASATGHLALLALDGRG